MILVIETVGPLSVVSGASWNASDMACVNPAIVRQLQLGTIGDRCQRTPLSRPERLERIVFPDPNHLLRFKSSGCRQRESCDTLNPQRLSRFSEWHQQPSLFPKRLLFVVATKERGDCAP